jgi:serine/threonine protein kinase
MFVVPEGAVPSGLPPRLEKFGRYFLVDRIAVGGMAEVYRAVTHGVEGFRRTFVVKRILAEKAASPSFIKMFCEEARISALLHHQNVVQVYDFGNVGGSYFLAMEFLPGKDLSSLLRVLRAAKAAVPPGLAAYVAREAANGLHYAHTLRGAGNQPLNIVHRDVTPSNVMLLFAGGVKVLDFGIAKAATESQDAEGSVKGKFGYLAPEQARGAEVDGRADVFALGVTLWEMLVGRRLFAGKDDFETLRNVMQKPVPPPSALRPEVPAALDRIVMRALERDRELRYATAEEMARDCDRVAREAHVDGQSLRTFLNDLFAEESSSLSSLGAADIPEELFQAAISAPVPVPTDSAVPRNGDSLEIQVVDASGAHARARTPAPPFGVMAAAGDALASRARWARFGKPAVVACGVAAAAAALLLVVSTWQSRHAARAAVVAAPVVHVPTPSVAPPAPPPVAPAAAPSVETSPAPTPPPAAAAPAEKPHRHHRSTPRGVATDQTLNPF